MRLARLYLHALRTARPRQLARRATRPVRRRLTRSGVAVGQARPLPEGVELWRSPAFANAPLETGAAATRLHGFHSHYGEDVLAAAREGDPEVARRAAHEWIARNPPRAGDAWHPYPLSTRVGNWVAALSLDPSLATPSVVESLGRQLTYLERNVEDDVLGNHVIRNARALILGGRALADAGAFARGMALLRRELPEQILSDGGHYERSPVYHLVVLRDLLEVRAASQADWLDEPIERMQRFGAGLQRPDGAPALFNDGTLDLAPQLDLPEPAPGLSVFEETGYAVLREPGLWLAFDCGPPAPPFLPAHAHADALSFQLWVDGRPIVVDPGTPTYEAGPERDWCRSTRAHATATLDDRNQFELWGAFRSGPLPVVRLLGTEPLKAECETATSVHRRSIRLEGDRLVIEDEAVGAQRITARLPLATPVEATADAIETRERGTLAERLYDPNELEIRAFTAERCELAHRVRLPRHPRLR